MKNEKICNYCNTPFSPYHGNELYCCDHHAELAKKERQKERRDPVAHLISIIMENHKILDRVFKNGVTQLTKENITELGIDISLKRFLKPPVGCKETLMLDFGRYALLTDTTFNNFKIVQHDTYSIIDSE